MTVIGTQIRFSVRKKPRLKTLNQVVYITTTVPCRINISIFISCTKKNNVDVEHSENKTIEEIGAFMGYYAANSGNFLPTFRDNLLVLW
jgi:hypothetical protein